MTTCITAKCETIKHVSSYHAREHVDWRIRSNPDDRFVVEDDGCCHVVDILQMHQFLFGYVRSYVIRCVIGM
jgi:hypothetical protein